MSDCPFTNAVERLVREATSVRVERLPDGQNPVVVHKESGTAVARFAPLFSPDLYHSHNSRCPFHPDVAFSFESTHPVLIEVCFSCNLVRATVGHLKPVYADCTAARSMLLATALRFSDDTYLRAFKE